MLAKKHRFQTSDAADFFRIARRWRGQYFDVLTYDAKSEQILKNTLIVSKKVSRSAVVRNRLRRLITPLLQQELKAHGDFWRGKILVVNFKPPAATADTVVFANEWQQYLQSLRRSD